MSKIFIALLAALGIGAVLFIYIQKSNVDAQMVEEVSEQSSNSEEDAERTENRIEAAAASEDTKNVEEDKS